MEEVVSLDQLSLSSLYEIWKTAFSDYGPVASVTEERFRDMLERRGYSACLSYGCTVNGDIVSITLNGSGVFDGVQSAYNTSTGTIAAFRSQQLAAKTLRRSIEELKAHSVRQYILEVLTTNEKAYSLYRKVGFSVSRELACFSLEVDATMSTIRSKSMHPLVECQPMRHHPQEKEVEFMWDSYPSWQNSCESIKRAQKRMLSIEAYLEHNIVGYGTIELTTGDVPQIAVDQSFRRQGIASEILRHLLLALKKEQSNVTHLKFINVPKDCSSMLKFLNGLGATATAEQFEMKLPIS